MPSNDVSVAEQSLSGVLRMHKLPQNKAGWIWAMLDGEFENLEFPLSAELLDQIPPWVKGRVPRDAVDLEAQLARKSSSSKPRQESRRAAASVSATSQ